MGQQWNTPLDESNREPILSFSYQFMRWYRGYRFNCYGISFFMFLSFLHIRLWWGMITFSEIAVEFEFHPLPYLLTVFGEQAYL